ncbi:hypothetical protein [Actinomadura sp. NPDC000600]|uniref:hypothetical protein n=1 Tax=Actinomadura sp. NPDC000600 TaxID=3154262 RepID=UPI0033961CDF
MGLDNPPGGPGKGPETTDKPTPPDTGGKASGDNPGADGKTPRIDSLRAAGWKIPEQPDTGNGQRDDRQGQSSESSSSDPAGDKPKTPADPPAETDPKAKEKPETGDAGGSSQPPEEHGHDKTDPAQTGNSGTETEKPGQAKPEDPRHDEGERGDADLEPKPGRAETDQTGGKDAPGKESPSQDSGSTADAPAPSGEQSPLPAEASQYPPGSRMESLARTREEQHANAEQRRAVFQDPQATEGVGKATAGDNGDGGVRPDGENAGKVEPGQEAQPPGTEIPTGGTGDTGGDDPVGGSDSSEPPTSGEGTEPPAPESARPQDQGHEPLPPQDSADPGDAGGDPPTEPPADGMPPADDQTPDGQGDPPPGSDVGQPVDPAAETGPAVPDPGREASSTGPETTDQGTEPREPKADAGGAGNEADAPKPVGETIPPAEEADENTTLPEALGEQSDGHGRNAEDPQSIESADETNPPGREAEQSGEGEESGTDLAPHEEGSTDLEPRRFAGNVKITLDRDGRPLPPDRPDVDTETPGRGELRDPDDDPEYRDVQERDPDRPLSLKDRRREMLKAAANLKKAVDENVKPAFEQFDSRPPRTEPCTARKNSDHIRSVDQPVKAGDAMVGVVSGVVVAVEMTRRSVQYLKRQMGREHASNG